MREVKEDRMKTDGVKHRCGIKMIIFVIMIISAVIFFGTILSARLMWSYGVFSSSIEEVETELGEDLTQTSGTILLSNYISGNMDYVEMFCGEVYSLEFEAVSGITSYKSEGIEGNSALVPYEQNYVWGDFIDWDSLEIVSYYGETLESAEESSYYTLISDNDQVTKLLSGIVFTEEEIEDFEQKQYLDYEIETIIYVDQTYPVMDVYYVQGVVIGLAYTVAPFIWYIIGFSFILCCVLFIFLLMSAGYRKGEKDRVICGTARIPYELYLLVVGGIGIVGAAILTDAYYDLLYGYLWSFVNGFIGIIMLIGSLTLFLMDLVVRISTRTLVSNLLIVKIWKWMNPVGRGKQSIKGVFRFFGKILGEIPTIWKGILLYLGVSFLALIMILPYWFGMRFFIWILANVLMLPMFIYVCIMLKRLQLASKSLGEGNLSYEVDTKYSIFEFKEMGESLNSIAVGMERAVEEKMKSERMKTELISNVSHDIKTPLTSIVNYADLISKEETQNDKIREYSAILLRQSDRLKRLTEDLVHASKVTTGNVEVHLAPCNVDVLLEQAIGEYTEKMSAVDLKIVSKQPEFPVMIEADGRHMWRVFDNLLNNICKYAQQGTRVYLILQKIENQVYITFKNISKYELNVSEEELMERFVRGDKSRHSEGNGLGLSIAKSLVNVQGGNMRVAIDGDLFKVVLNFKTYEQH